MNITVTYASIDGARKEESFTDLVAARAFATDWVGAHPDIAAHYAVSSDGIGKVTVRGCTLGVLFGLDTPVDALPFYIEEVSINEDAGASTWHKVPASGSATLEAVLHYINSDVFEGTDGVRIVATTDEAKAELQAYRAAREAANVAAYDEVAF